MMGNYLGGGYGYMGGFGFFLMILFWGLIIWAVIAGIKMMSGGQGRPCCGGGVKKEDGAAEVLRTRYAKGEITKEQFDQMKKDLEM